MEKMNQNYTFQTDSEFVKKVYREQSNYLIEFNEKGDRKWCAIYFCSNDIYYPNTEDIFYKKIIEKNYYEWYHLRIKRAYKHIFIRDIFKQWYLAGINITTNTPEKLIQILQKETKDYNVITLGSSAGGYAAILYGSFINTKYTLAFNPQFELQSLIKRSSPQKNPLLFNINDKRIKFFDITNFISSNIDIFYFYSNASSWDIDQCNYIKGYTNIHKIEFNTKHHGIPFLKVALSKTINLDIKKLKSLSLKTYSPIIYTIQMVGVKETLKGLYQQLIKFVKKKI